MRRLFAVGDSFAQHQWPMWPSVLSQNFDETYSGARSGAGNFYIFHKTIELLNTKNITPADTVVVQWTAPTRVDAIRDGLWKLKGDLSAEMFRNDDSFSMFNSDQLCLIKQLTYMLSLSNILDKIGCNWYYIFLNNFSMVHLDTHLKEFDINMNYEMQHQAIENSYLALKKSVQSYSERMVQPAIADYVVQKFPIDTWKYTYHEIKDGHEIKYIDTHPSTLQIFFWIDEVLSKYIPNLDRTPMENYARHIEGLMGTLTVDGKYNPWILHKYLTNFEELNNYKKIKHVY